MHETQERLIGWAGRCNLALRSYLDLCQPHFSTERHPAHTSYFVLTQLMISCHATSESALILIGNVRVYDAEMLIRSVFEGTLKYVFLCMGDDAARAAKADEYWNVLPAISRLKRHQRVGQFLEAVGEPENQHDQWRPLRDMLMNEAEADELQKRFPKKTRQPLEQKWSFGELGQVIAREGGRGFDVLKHLMFGYGMASHHIHQDADAIGVLWDRARREPERHEAVQMAHGCRCFTDMVVMAMIRTLMLHKAVGADRKPVCDLFDSHGPFLAEMNAVHEAWRRVEYGPEPVQSEDRNA